MKGKENAEMRKERRKSLKRNIVDDGEKKSEEIEKMRKETGRWVIR